MRVGLLIFAGVLLFGGAPALAQEAGGGLEAVVVEMASTPEQHQALAQYYRGRAKEARAESKRHEHMAHSYGAGKMVQRAKMKKHCENLVTSFAAQAKDLDELAVLHGKEAGQ